MTHASVRCASQNHFLLSKMQVPCVVDRGLAGLHGPLSDVGRSRRPPGLTSAYTMMAGIVHAGLVQIVTFSENSIILKD